MRSRYRFAEPDDTYFVTATVVAWIPALVRPEYAAVVVDSLAYARSHLGLQIYAYVVMDNHFHLVGRAPDLSKTMQSIKRHTAREIVGLAERSKHEWLLQQFGFHKKGHKSDSLYQVWQEGVHPQQIASEEMLHQKIEYVHVNPVRRKWVDAPEHWRYSSARNYFLGDDSVLGIDSLHE